jgi:hypothetical protein
MKRCLKIIDAESQIGLARRGSVAQCTLANRFLHELEDTDHIPIFSYGVAARPRSTVVLASNNI